MDELAKGTEGFSGSDIANMVNDAVMEPVRELESCISWVNIRESETALLDIGFHAPPSLVYAPASYLSSKSETVDASIYDIPQSQLCAARAVRMSDFRATLTRVKPSLSAEDVRAFDMFTANYGVKG